MEIRQLIRDVRHNLVVALAAFVVCVVIGGAAAFLPAKQYAASTLLTIQPAPGFGSNSNVGSLISIVGPQLPAEATSASNVARATANVPQPYQSDSASVDATIDPGTFIVTIKATSTSKVAASKFANSVARQLIAFQPKPAVSGYQVTQLSPAIPPSSPSNPRTPILLG